jgi:hypothetical protein
MRKYLKVSLFILLVAGLAWASDPWNDKPYTQWSMKDVDKVMNESPWSRMIHITTGFGIPGRMGTPSGTGSQQPTGAPMSGGPPTQESNGMPAGMERTADFEARWVSALTMRQALARAEILDGKMSQADAERYLAKPPANYQIAVFGPNMSAFATATETALTNDSYLEAKGEKKKVAPANVKFTKSGDGKVEAITFEFPKTVNGQPVIGPKEKSVDFVCKVKDLTLKFHFDPRKMTNKQGLDL